MMRSLGAHVALLALAVLAALYVWTRDKKATAAAAADVTVWPGRADDVQGVVFEAKGKKVTLDAKKDAAGRWFLGTSLAAASPAADAGAAPPAKTVTFASVAEGEKVAKGLSPLKALRDLGKLESDRAAEFGLKEPSGEITVTLSGAPRRLALGGPTPGSGGRYVRDDASGEVYAIKADFVRSLESGDASLTERDLHGFKDPDLTAVRVVARGKSRSILRRGPENKRIWADPADADKADETATNWLAKIERLRPTEYVPDLGAAPEMVVRLEYTVKGSEGVFLELAKTIQASGPAPLAGKADYVVRTEWTRLWAKVPPTVAEQVEQDLASVLAGAPH